MLIGILINIINALNHTKCVFLNNHQCMVQPPLINLHPNEYNQGLHYYLFGVDLDRCIRSYNTLNDLSNSVCIPNKIEDLNLSVFNMITWINRKH